MPTSSSSEIPTYDSAGRRIRAYSLEAVEHLLSLSLVVVRRNRRGVIVACHFRPQDGANPLRNSAHMGQRYSVLENVGDSGSRAWKHRSLLQAQDVEELTGVPMDSPADVDLYLRGIFRRVALSCMVPAAAPPAPAPPAPSKVIPIRPGGSKKPKRPVEFDSEARRAA